ncbi:NAD-dependent epimerase/dehydratase family protein [Thermodesulfobacteriota bacterium]
MGKVLVTGATGFVGAALVKQLLGQGQQVRITVRRKSDLRNIQGLDVEMAEADILDADGLRTAIKGCSALYHVAGLYRTWMRDYGLLQQVNVEGTRNVLAAARDAGVEKVVHTSSIGALGLREDGKPSDENTAFNLYALQLPYEASKFESEQVALAFARDGLPLVVVRPALVMGEGDMYPTPSGKVVLDVLLGRIPSYFEGGIDVVDVADVAAGHILAMEKGVAGASYNLGCVSNFTTMQNLFGLIAAEGGVAAPRLRVPVFMALQWARLLTALSDYITHREPLATPANIQALAMKKRVDFSRAVSELGIPQTRLPAIIAKTVSWYRKEGYI